MYLVDTNIWLERLLDQEKSESVGEFLSSFSSDNFFITDFSLHSIGVILNKLKMEDTFLQFIDDIFENGDVSIIELEPFEMVDLIEAIKKFNLDFDDAYQYVSAQKYDLTIVSLDKDFNKTDRGKKLPEEV